ncbi:putative transcriptional regulator, TetR family [Bradyrhizobium sp. ORS 285]|uniref:TetR/AcrR family transcriptional regulator n=1 Tax=Bradyrhizobium sp. ORS 285 TaxID=115808 RepID=UPI00024072B7|nr:TetR/AcrR family transcriptional regulator [Bradyrhizobium sp. ORS 285]CCD84955.1 putative transcriptional regulator, TetR family [Bradyrhizobium sp. ORS 285]SMX62280.1 putative transcriptional regulator, TetR family [Bradyrhizobium sp. ORS 285]
MRTLNERADVIPMLAEVFRELGFEGASLSRITERTGLGKGSLYHFFPGGKDEMARAVLAHVDGWFEREIYVPLRDDAPDVAIARMWRGVDDYFRSGRRVCLVGAFALDGTRDRFAAAIASYFTRWIESLRDALVRDGWPATEAADRAEEVVLGIQGALVLARATGDEAIFGRALARFQGRLRQKPSL